MAKDDDRIKSLSQAETEKLLGQEIFRSRVKEILDEQTNSVDFMEKVRKYAGMEIDSRLFVSSKYWVTTIVSAALASGIGYYISKL